MYSSKIGIKQLQDLNRIWGERESRGICEKYFISGGGERTL